MRNLFQRFKKKNTNIYELNTTQFSTLQGMANTGNNLLFPDLIPKATKANKKSFDQHVRWLNDILNLGLIKEVSDQHKEGIEKCKKDNGYGFRVFEITELGKMLCDKGEIN